MTTAQSLRVVIPGATTEPAMVRRSVLLVIENSRLLRSVTRVMRASHIDLVSCTDVMRAPEWLIQAPQDLVICDYDLVQSLGNDGVRILQQLSEHPSKTPLILLSERQGPDDLARFLEQHYADNVVAKLGELDNGDLLTTARKLIERDLFGIEKYLRWGACIHSYPIRESNEKNTLLGRLESFLDELQCPERLTGLVLTVADEFLMNALYDAPTDANGVHLHAKRSRVENVILPPHQTAELSFGSDGRFLTIGCRDPFGSLQASRVRASLARCLRRGDDQINQSAGGAGLGLYMIFQIVSHLVINIDPGRCTEFIGVIDLTQGARKRHDQARSLNIFTRR